MRATPGGLQQGLALVPAPVASRVVTDHRQVKGHLAFFGTLQGRGGPVAVFLSGQGVGPGGASRCRGLYPVSPPA